MLISKLKKIRIEQNFTQEELARRADMTLNGIQKLEKDNCNPRIKNCYKIKNILNVKHIEDIFKDE